MLRLASPGQIHGLHIVPPGQPRRAELEAFIQHHYARIYQAELHHFMPLLLGLYDAAGNPFAVLGLRAAGAEALYLEQYLDAPVEQSIAAAVNQPVARSQIMEMGHFAVARPAGAVWMILLSTAYLQAGGASWACATMVPILAKALYKLGLQPSHLAEVDPARLRDTHTRWGSYYQRQPQVLAYKVEEGFAMIQDLLRQSLYWQRGLDRLWEHAYQAGLAA